MKSSQVLAILSTGFAPALAQSACNGKVHSTVGYTAALSAQNGACPTATPGAWSLAHNGAGCCQSGQQIHTVGESGAACCPCGAACTGFFPEMIGWNENGGENEKCNPA